MDLGPAGPNGAHTRDLGQTGVIARIFHVTEIFLGEHKHPNLK